MWGKMGAPSIGLFGITVIVFLFYVLPSAVVLYLLSQGIYYLLKKKMFGPRWLFILVMILFVFCLLLFGVVFWIAYPYL